MGYSPPSKGLSEEETEDFENAKEEKERELRVDLRFSRTVETCRFEAKERRM